LRPRLLLLEVRGHPDVRLPPVQGGDQAESQAPDQLNPDYRWGGGNRKFPVFRFFCCDRERCQIEKSSVSGEDSPQKSKKFIWESPVSTILLQRRIFFHKNVFKLVKIRRFELTLIYMSLKPLITNVVSYFGKSSNVLECPEGNI
jgi:hypothetical protein